jgi:hypothetical protein
VAGIEDVYSIAGRGTVVTGSIERGVVRVNDEIEVVGLRPTIETTCTCVEIFRKLVDEGRAGENVGILLRSVKREEVRARSGSQQAPSIQPSPLLCSRRAIPPTKPDAPRINTGGLFDGSPIVSAIADMIPMSIKEDMYFKEDIPYSVRYEGHDIAQPRTAGCRYPLEA